MKKTKNIIAKFTLFVMISSFLLVPISNINAASSDAVMTYIEKLNSISKDMNYKLNEETKTSKYLNNKNYQYAIDNVKNELNKLDTDYKNYQTSLKATISLEKVLASNNTLIFEEYKQKIGTDKLINFSLIDDITYYDEDAKEEKILITGTDLASLINNTYFKAYEDKYNSFSNNYETNINNYQTIFNQIDESYNNSVSTIESYIIDIEDFIKKETQIGNSPNITYENSDIISKLNSFLDDLKQVYDNTLTTDSINEFNLIVNKATAAYNKFYKNNANLTDELITKLTSLTNDYATYKQDLTNLFISIDTEYQTPDYQKVSVLEASKIKEFIQKFEESTELEKKYLSLITEINTYLTRKSSEAKNIETYLENLNSYYSELNWEKITKTYNGFVYNANIKDENIVDTLLSFTGLKTTSKEYQYLKAAKLEFYTLSLKNKNKYSIKESGNYLVIEGLDNITNSSFINNLDYNGKYELVTNDKIINKNTSLKLYDKDGNYLRTLKLVIKNDINGDGLINNADVNLLKNKVLKNSFTSYEKIAGDINNDNKINISDVINLNFILNKNVSQSSATKASLKINKTESDNKIIYNIYLNTNGTVNGFEYNILASNNLKLLSIRGSKGVSYLKNGQNIRVVGLGNYENNCLLLTLTYKKITDKTDLNLKITQGIIVSSNSLYKDNLSYQSTIKYSKDNPIQANNLVNENTNNDNTRLASEDKTLLESPKQDIKNKSTISNQELDEEDIAWGNIIKIALIVLLGALIIYFLNKDAEVNFDEENQVNSSTPKESSNSSQDSDYKNNTKET